MGTPLNPELFVVKKAGIKQEKTQQIESAESFLAGAQGLEFCGIIHSHPAGQTKLSEADLSYIHTIMDSMPEQIRELYFPIVIPGEDIFSYLTHREGIITSDRIIITKEI